MEIVFVFDVISYILGFITPGVIVILWVLGYGIKKGISANKKKANAASDMNGEWEKLLNQFNRLNDNNNK